MFTSNSPIIIEPYNAAWITAFQNEAALIHQVIDQYITVIEHIGSTSVPGLAAKPIIDMLIGINTLSDSPLIIPHLTDLGYVYKPEYELELPERRYFYKSKSGQDLYHLHVVESNTEFFRRHIAFRDYLRLHPETAADYAALKIRLAKEFGTDREGYTNAKTTFIKNIENKVFTR